MSPMYYMPVFAAPEPVSLPLRDRTMVVASVVLVHVLLLWSYASLSGLFNPAHHGPAHHEMSISMSLPEQSQTAPKPQPVVNPKAIGLQPVQPTPQAAIPAVPVDTPPSPVESNTPVSTGPVTNGPVTNGLADREPDYQAAYLNNPKPEYPIVANRMGWQGRVVLNVEVLASGLPGQIKLHQSSGHDVLDNAAMQAVHSWRFVAARQGGQVIAKWLLVPISFMLKDAE